MKEQQNQFQEQLVADVKADFEKRRQARLSIEQAWRLNMNFMVGNQFSEINAKGDIDETCKQFYWQERSVFNHIAPIVETRLAKLSRVRSGVTVRPLTTDEQDVSAAKFSTAILNSIIAENKLPNLLNTANAWSEICGTVFYKVVWDGEKGTKYTFNGKTASDGDVSVMVVPPFEIYPESLEGDLDSQSSIMHVKAYSASEVKDLWGVDVKPQKVNVFNMQNAVVSGGFGYNSTVPNVSEEIKDDAVVVIEKFELPTAEFPNGRHVIVAGDRLVYMGELPYENGEEGKRKFPFVRQVSLDNTGAFFGASVVERCVPVQRAYNAVKNRKLEFLNRIAMGVLAVEDGSVDTEQLADEGLCPGKILVYRQGSTPPVMMNAGSVPTDFQREEDRLLQEFTMISGVSEVMGYSRVPENVTSGTAISLIIEQDDTRMSITANNLRAAILEIGKQILRLYKQFATTRRLKRIAGENGEVDLVYFTGNDLTSDDIAFDTENDLSATAASRRSMVMQILSMGLLNDENGTLSPRNKARVLEILGFGNWESSKDIEELNIKKAMRENLKIKDGGEALVPDETDEHSIHIAEHTKFILSQEYDGACDVKSRVLEHITLHRQAQEMANQIKNV